MTTVAVELNDAGVVAAGAGLQWKDRSPGVALLDGHRILVGREAVSRARLKPRWVANRFWDRLDTQPLGRPFPRDLRNADLVHAHLTEVWQRVRQGMDSRSAPDIEAVVLAVPGFYSERQLGLLLGVGRACGMPIAGMVDAAVAASVAATKAERALHVDVLLQRVVLTEMGQAGSLARQRVESEESTGLAKVMDLWAKLIASRFVQQTRFDPFHHGETEQDLYDRLPGWIDEIGRDGGALLTLEHRGKVHRAEISAGEIQEAVGSSYRAISNLVRAMAATGSRPGLVLTQTVSSLPGLQSELEEAVGSEAVVLASGAAATGALQQQHLLVRVGDPEVDFVAELPSEPRGGRSGVASESRSETSGAASETKTKPPTHLLYEGVAHPIDGDPLVLGVAIPTGAKGVDLTGPTAGVSRRHCSLWVQGDEVIVEDHSTYGSFLNGSRIEGRAVLAAGDRLRLGAPGIELHLIAVG
ncbi:MAG: FHA domain-containing protein [Thermoanaerobaculia bacterium]